MSDCKGLNVTIFNRTGGPLGVDCAGREGQLQIIPKDSYLTVSWPVIRNGLDRYFIDIRPFQKPPIMVRVPESAGGVTALVYVDQGKALTFPIPANEPGNLWVDVYEDGDFWIRRGLLSFTADPVEITLNVTTDLPALPATVVDFQVADGQARKRARKHPDGNRVVVNSEADLRFRVNSPGTKNYRPMAMVVRRTDDTSSNATDKAGWQTFGFYRIDGNTITVRDGFKLDKSRYKYCVLVQNDDGQVGLIDPEIENDSTDQP